MKWLIQLDLIKFIVEAAKEMDIKMATCRLHRIYWRFSITLILSMLSMVSVFELLAHDVVHANLPLVQVLADECAKPANAIVAENCLPGTTDWQIKSTGKSIVGFTSPSSINLGEKIDFLIQTSAPKFNLYIYRSGYYNGLGARLIQVLKDVPSVAQPACNFDYATGLSSCSNWNTSYSLEVPLDWTSGVYMVRMENPTNGEQNYIVFVVRDDQRHSPMLFQLASATYQAYNPFNGKSIYNFNSDFCVTSSGARRAAKVSYDRPLEAEFGYANTFVFVDFQMVYWLESQGYDLSYVDSTDLNRYGKPGSYNGLLDHKVFLTAGHDEYWSSEMRDAVTQARDKGVHLAFLTSNTIYWRIRFEPDPFTGEPDRVIVSYKTSEGQAVDPSGIPTGTWRDPQGSNDPESSLVGVQYVGDNDSMFFPIQLNADMARDRIYRHTDLQDMPPDTTVQLGKRLLGWEWDAVNPDFNPNGLTVLAASPAYGGLLVDSGNYLKNQLNTTTANVTRYVAPSGAIVFAAGTNLWSHGLALVEPNLYIQQITYNIFADMGLQPATPSSTLVLDGDSKIVSSPDKDRSRFYSASEPPIPGAVISNIITNVNGSQVTVGWNTDVDARGQVYVGMSPDAINMILGTGDSVLQTQHNVSLVDLGFNQTYYFKIATVNADNQFSFSETQTFATGSSISTQAVNAAKDAARTVRCWVRVNRTPTIILGGLLSLLVIAVLVWFFMMRLRKRPAAKLV